MKMMKKRARKMKRTQPPNKRERPMKRSPKPSERSKRFATTKS